MNPSTIAKKATLVPPPRSTPPGVVSNLQRVCGQVLIHRSKLGFEQHIAESRALQQADAAGKRLKALADRCVVTAEAVLSILSDPGEHDESFESELAQFPDLLRAAIPNVFAMAEFLSATAHLSVQKAAERFVAAGHAFQKVLDACVIRLGVVEMSSTEFAALVEEERRVEARKSASQARDLGDRDLYRHP